MSLVASTDADKEGFLRSERALIQTIGRAARNSEGRVILYGDKITKSMQKAMDETSRRRQIQMEYNTEHGITPKTIEKKIHKSLSEIYGYEPSGTGRKNIVVKVDDPKKLKKLIDPLKKEMQEAAKKLDFERAAELRDQIKKLELSALEA